MKTLITLNSLLALLTLNSFGQTCTLSSSDNTNAKVVNCINAACPPSCNSVVNVVVPENVVINLNGDWSLTAYDIVLDIQGVNSAINFDNSNEDIQLSANSGLKINSSNSDGLTANNGGNKRIYIGSTEFKGNDFSSIISAGGATSFGTGAPLPIELKSFEVTQNNNEVLVSWVTSTEKDNDYFLIEKSYDGITFEEVATVNGAGNSTSEVTYSIIDASPNYDNTVAYYRLKQVDYNGEFEYFNIVAVDLSSVALNGALDVYPNPAKNEVRLFTNDDATEVHYEISNMHTGEGMNGVIEKGMPIDILNLSKGVYKVSVSTTEGMVVRKLIVK